MLSFDVPFSGSITSQSGDDYISLELEGVSFSTTVDQTFTVRWMDGIRLFESNGNFYMVAVTPRKVETEASMTANGFGLRIRLKPLPGSLPTIKESNPQTTTSLNTIASASNTPVASPANPAQDESQADFYLQDTIDMSTYLTIIFILSVLLVVLWVIKRKFAPNSKQGSWLMNKLPSGSAPAPQEIKIINQKQLDMKNRIVLFESDNIRYLVIVGSNGLVVLDKSYKAETNTSAPQSQFDSILSEHSEQLEHFMGSEQQQLERYKNKASDERHADFASLVK